MARGNGIILSQEPRGRFLEGIIKTGQTPKPGTIMQIDPTVAEQAGRHTWKVYDRDLDGDRPAGPMAVLLHDKFQGKLATDAYAAGDRCFLYVPLPGDELNLLFMNVAGTADDVALGDIMIVDDGTGKMIKTTGTVETEVAIAMEAYVDPTADKLLFMQWSGF